MLMMLLKIENNLAPDYLVKLLKTVNYECVNYNILNNQEFVTPNLRFETFKRPVFSLLYKSSRLIDEFKNHFTPKAKGK